MCLNRPIVIENLQYVTGWFTFGILTTVLSTVANFNHRRAWIRKALSGYSKGEAFTSTIYLINTQTNHAVIYYM